MYADRVFVETSLREFPMPQVAEMARRAEALGFDGLTFSEVRQDPMIVAAVAAPATTSVQLATSVTIAFPRSPTVLAYGTRNLQDLSGGRFSLGLGSTEEEVDRVVGVLPRLVEKLRGLTRKVASR